MSHWYEPHEQWPKHQKPWWRETITMARSAGWRLQMIEGHAWGRLVCDPSLDKPCKILIFSTGTAGESAARSSRNTIQRCDHGTAQDADQLLFRAAELLDRAEALLEAASRCLQAADKKTEAEELITGAATAAEEAEKLAQALQREEDSERLLVEAFAVLPDGGDLGVPPTSDQVHGLIAEAGVRADEAERLTDDSPTGNCCDTLRARIAQVRVRVSQLSERLERGWNAGGPPCA